MEKNKDWKPTWFMIILWSAIAITPLQLIQYAVVCSWGGVGVFNIVYTIITSIIHVVGCVLMLRKNKYGFIIFVPLILNIVLSMFVWQDDIIIRLFTLVFWVAILLIHHNGKPIYRYILEGK